MSLRSELRPTAEAEVKEALKAAHGGIRHAAIVLNCDDNDVCKALLPRNSTIMRKLVNSRLESIEASLVERYNDQADLPLTGEENGKD